MSIDRAVDVLATKEAILVFTGAGISTESGIPDFRGPDGVWTKVDPADFTIDRYLTDQSVRERSWSMRAQSGALDAQPNNGHRAITRLWRSGRVVGCVTQNIDALHQAAGLPAEAIVEIHGNAHQSRCVECDQVSPTSDVLTRLEGGDSDPRCDQCGGILKVDVVFFGEHLPPEAMTRALSWAGACDAVLAVGSTLSVFPAATIPLTALDDGAPLVIVNQGPTELDDAAAVLVREAAGEALSAIASALE